MLCYIVSASGVFRLYSRRVTGSLRWGSEPVQREYNGMSKCERNASDELVKAGSDRVFTLDWWLLWQVSWFRCGGCAGFVFNHAVAGILTDSRRCKSGIQERFRFYSGSLSALKHKKKVTWKWNLMILFKSQNSVKHYWINLNTCIYANKK